MTRSMTLGRVLAGVAMIALVTTAVAADEAPKVPTLDRDRLRVFGDGKGHLVALGVTPVVPARPGAPPPRTTAEMFYGTSKEMWNVHVTDSGAVSITVEDDRLRSLDAGFTDPRSPKARLQLDGTTLTITCGPRSTTLRELPAAETRKLVAKVTLSPIRFTRMPVLLARDDETTYFYVDIPRDESTEYSLYTGKRGSMARIKLTDVAEDAAGLVLVTAKGTLRVMYGKARGDARVISWGRPKQPRKTALELVDVPLTTLTQTMIFNELGPYIGQRFGTPCDDM